MAGEASVFGGIDLHSKTNNFIHHTSVISVDRLIVRRGQAFKLTLNLKKAFDQNKNPLLITAVTGEQPSEVKGTRSLFGLPDPPERSGEAKAVWRVALHPDSKVQTGRVALSVTPAPDSPIGEYTLRVRHRDEETALAQLVLLYNPWCTTDWVYMESKKEIKEYVLNESGVIFRGSHDYIFPLDWDYGQFEENMLQICLKLLDVSNDHLKDPGEDASARWDPGYVGRVVSAMINSQGDKGVVMGNWSSNYDGGRSPSHWSGSYSILNKWLKNEFKPVQYGQCWVFAAVMCSVMRLLGVPCRVVSNFVSAHDTDSNLTIDTYHADDGVQERHSPDSIWNFHVWTECWMKRGDLAKDGTYDGWQVLDPTPQEMSDGAFCCGPASVKAILNGRTSLKYDVPFVFAEVNADCVDWLVLADDSLVKMESDTKRVGRNISTKAVGSKKRNDITHTYKFKEGSEKERSIYRHAIIDYSSVEDDEDEEEDMEVEGDDGDDEDEGGDSGENAGENIEVEEVGDADNVPSDEDDGDETEGNETTGGDEETAVPPPPVIMHFEEVTPPTNGKNVRLRLVLQSDSSAPRPLSINISVQAMKYNGRPAANIQKSVHEKTLMPGVSLHIPIRVLYSDYSKPMLGNDSMKVSAVTTDKKHPEFKYLMEDDVVLLDPPITLEVPKVGRKFYVSYATMIFMNPISETLTNCSMTLSGSGLFRDEVEYKLPDILVNNRLRVKFPFRPYKRGNKKLQVVFDCSAFKDIKAQGTINVK